MIKPEQIQDEVVISASEAWLRSDVNAQSDWRVAIAAALNAWPGVCKSESFLGLSKWIELPIEEKP